MQPNKFKLFDPCHDQSQNMHEKLLRLQGKGRGVIVNAGEKGHPETEIKHPNGARVGTVAPGEVYIEIEAGAGDARAALEGIFGSGIGDLRRLAFTDRVGSWSNNAPARLERPDGNAEMDIFKQGLTDTTRLSMSLVEEAIEQSGVDRLVAIVKRDESLTAPEKAFLIKAIALQRVILPEKVNEDGVRFEVQRTSRFGHQEVEAIEIFHGEARIADFWLYLDGWANLVKLDPNKDTASEGDLDNIQTDLLNNDQLLELLFENNRIKERYKPETIELAKQALLSDYVALRVLRIPGMVENVQSIEERANELLVTVRIQASPYILPFKTPLAG